MEFIDFWPGPDIADRIGHAPGAWDCPCGPWIHTDMDAGEHGQRTIRHVDFCPTCGVPRPCPTEEALNDSGCP